jgi:GTP-binding protein
MLDEVKIFVKSGAGGAGLVAFRREKYVPRGGPAGGDGGKGGDVILRVDPKINTLDHFQGRVHFRAEDGKRGGNFNRTGKSGEDLVIKVPPGTIVYDADSGERLADLTVVGQEAIVLKGGRGGRGNAKFANSRNQAPRYAERGEPAQERWLRLELKLIADVGIVGVPNAGKSTFLSVISNAHPKIADYPFTTLEPNLGVVRHGYDQFLAADIPGLIEGAHMGVGLGHSFLRHAQRNRVLVHLLDGMAQDPIADFSQINAELALFDPELGEKPMLVVLNKMDMPTVQERWPEIEEAVESLGYPIMAMSAITHQGVNEVVNRIFHLLDEVPEPEIGDVEMHVDALPKADFTFRITRDSEGAYHIYGEQIERAAQMTYWDYHEAVLRFQDTLRTLGITDALQEAGVKVGDTVFIGDFEMEWGE